MNLEKFLNFLSPLPSPAEIKNWDSVAGEYGLDEFLLMENAGRSALSVLLNYRPNLKNKKIILFMGKGNNGGDAACLARNLIDYGDGSADKLFAALLGRKKLSAAQIEKLKQIVGDLE